MSKKSDYNITLWILFRAHSTHGLCGAKRLLLKILLAEGVLVARSAALEKFVAAEGDFAARDAVFRKNFGRRRRLA